MVCVTAETCLELCYKVASNRAAAGGGGVLTTLREPMTWLGVALWAVESIAWVLVLRTLPLSQAYPAMCLTYLTIPLACRLLLKEGLSARKLWASALIAVGVALIAGRQA